MPLLLRAGPSFSKFNMIACGVSAIARFIALANLAARLMCALALKKPTLPSSHESDVRCAKSNPKLYNSRRTLIAGKVARPTSANLWTGLRAICAESKPRKLVRAFM